MARLKPKQVLEARDFMVDAYYRRDPGRGRAAAVRRVMEELGPEGRRRVAVAEGAAAVGGLATRAGTAKSPAQRPSKAQRKASKKAAKAAAKVAAKRTESLKRRIGRAVDEALAQPGVREALTAAQGPRGARGAGAAAGPAGDGLFALMASQSRAPYFQLPGSPEPARGRGGQAAVPTPEQFAAMSADELSAYGGPMLQADADARGLNGPIWRDRGGLLSTAQN